MRSDRESPAPQPQMKSSPLAMKCLSHSFTESLVPRNFPDLRPTSELYPLVWNVALCQSYRLELTVFLSEPLSNQLRDRIEQKSRDKEEQPRQKECPI